MAAMGRDACSCIVVLTTLMDHRLEVPQGEVAKGGSDWSFVGDLPGHALSPFKSGIGS
jgi:hypothetical protein